MIAQSATSHAKSYHSGTVFSILPENPVGQFVALRSTGKGQLVPRLQHWNALPRTLQPPAFLQLAEREQQEPARQEPRNEREEVPGNANSKASGIRPCPDVSRTQVPTNSRIGRHSSGRIRTGRSAASRIYSVLSMPRLWYTVASTSR